MGKDRGASSGAVTQDSLQQWEKRAVRTHAPLQGPRSVSPAAPQRPRDGSGETRAARRSPRAVPGLGARGGPEAPDATTRYTPSPPPRPGNAQAVLGGERPSDWPEGGSWCPAQVLGSPGRLTPGGQGQAVSRPLGQCPAQAGAQETGRKGAWLPSSCRGVRCCARQALDVAQSPSERPPDGEGTSHTGAQVTSSMGPHRGTWLGGALALESGRSPGEQICSTRQPSALDMQPTALDGVFPLWPQGLGFSLAPSATPRCGTGPARASARLAPGSLAQHPG